MTTWSAAWHVLRFDLRRQRTLLVTFSAGLALAVAVGVGAIDSSATGFALLPIAVFLQLLVMLTLSVQADPPADPTAWWRAKPLVARDLITAKVLSALVLLAAIVLATGLAALISGATAVEMGEMIAATCVGALPWLSYAVALGATATDRRQVIPLVVGSWLIVLAWAWLSSEPAFAWLRLFDVSPTLWWTTYGIIVMGATGLLIRQYHRPMPRRVGYALATIVGTLSLHLIRWPMPAAHAAHTLPSTIVPPAGADAEQLVIDRIDMNPENAAIYTVHLRVANPRQGVRYLLDGVNAVAHFQDGSQVMGSFSRVEFPARRSDIVLPAGVIWREPGSGEVIGKSTISIWEPVASTRSSPAVWGDPQNPVVNFVLTGRLARLDRLADTTTRWTVQRIAQRGTATVAWHRDGSIKSPVMRLRLSRVLTSARAENYPDILSAIAEANGVPTVVHIDGAGRARPVNAMYGEAINTRQWITPFVTLVSRDLIFFPSATTSTSDGSRVQVVRWRRATEWSVSATGLPWSQPSRLRPDRDSERPIR